MLSAFEGNKLGHFDWPLGSWLKVISSKKWIYFDISSAGKANGSTVATFISNSSVSDSYEMTSFGGFVSFFWL